jgi:hypothetical protein
VPSFNPWSRANGSRWREEAGHIETLAVGGRWRPAPQSQALRSGPRHKHHGRPSPRPTRREYLLLLCSSRQATSKFVIMNLLLYRLRRTLLRVLVPEFVWPRRVVLDGVSIRVRHAPYSFGVKLVLTRGEYEVDERRVLLNILQPGDVVVEMGGSIGILSAIIAEKVGKSGFVVSVEASATLTGYSRTWLESGNNVRVITGFGFPVWRLQHSVDIQKFEEKWGSMSGRVTFNVTGSATDDRPGRPSHPLYDVKALSEYAPRPPGTLVVDIEGSERIICSQKPEFPPSLRNLLIELHPEIYGDSTMTAIIGRIEEEGFVKVGEQGNVFHFTRSSAV